MKKVFVIILTLASGSVFEARAAFSNENSLLVGDLSAGMGGAAVAVVGDAAGAPFYNPGTMAFLQGAAFSAAVGIYKKFDMLYGSEEDFARAPLRVNQGYFRSLPASTGSVVRWEKLPEWTVALSVVVPDYEQHKGDLRNDSTNVSTLSYTDESLWVGGAMARKISETEGFGFTVYYTARNLTRTAVDRSKPSGTVTELFSQERTVTDNALVATLGYYKQVDESWSWGAAARLPSLKISGRGTFLQSFIRADTGLGTVETNEVNLPEQSSRGAIPAKVTVGASWRPDSTWIMAADLSLREAIGFNDLEDSTYAIPVNHRSVWNLSLGAEKWALDWLKIRAGVYTNFSSQPDPDPNLQKVQEDRVDMLGFSTNLVFIAGQKISYTFGGYYTGGRGRSIQRIDQTYTVVPKTAHVFTMLVGTSFSF